MPSSGKNNTENRPWPRVLIVDDQPENVRILYEILKESYQVFFATQGEKALAIARAEPLDLILLDIFMPEMDGYEVCRRLKNIERNRDIPVIFISALSEIESKVRAFQSGGVDYILKPFQPEEVLARVGTHIAMAAMKTELERRNQSLQAEIAERRIIQEALARARDELEQRVEERTADIRAAYEQLEKENNERRRAEEALSESEERFRVVTESIREVVWLTTVGTDPRVLYVNPAFESIFGRKREELYANNRLWQEQINPEDRRGVIRAFLDFMAGRGEFDMEFRLFAPDGLQKWLWARGVLVADQQGRIHRTVGVAQDITARKEAENALKVSDEMFRQLAENLRDVFWIRDVAGQRMLFVSRAYEEIWGRPRTEVLENPRAFMDSIWPEDLPRIREAMARQSEGLEFFHDEYRLVRPDGQVRWIRARNWPVFDSNGQIYRVVGVAEDITQRKNEEEILLKAKEAAEKANLAKSEFLANVSHELRTPLNPIIGLAELLLESDLTLEQRGYLTDVRTASHMLLRTVNTLIELSRIEAHGLVANCQPFELEAALEGPLKGSREAAMAKGLELSCQVAPDLPRLLHGDAAIFSRVLGCILENAVKFTDTGSVSVSLRRWSDGTEIVLPAEGRTGRPGDESGADAKPEVDLLWSDSGECSLVPDLWLEVAVRDTGVGIPAERLATLFQDFTQIDGSLTRKHGGLGLGLTLARRLVQVLRGRIWAESQDGQGSTFIFIIPVGAIGGLA